MFEEVRIRERKSVKHGKTYEYRFEIAPVGGERKQRRYGQYESARTVCSGAYQLNSKILDPLALLEHESTDGAFDQFQRLAYDEQGQDGESSEPAQAEGDRYADTAHKATVEQEGDHGLSAGPKGKVGGVGIRIEGHHAGVDADQGTCQGTDGVGGVVQQGEQTGAGCHQDAEDQTGKNGNKQ